MVEPVDDRSPTAQALSTVSHITAISLMMVIPAIIGYFVDRRMETLFLFTAIGFALGMGSAIWQLILFVRVQDQPEETRQQDSTSDHVDGDR